MTSIIKNQIIKHLSTFARNITPDQISVEVLRGKGELRNIELNETVLEERLELPPWLQIRRAVCSRVKVKVPWTKLKSSAVELSIDEIEVDIHLSASNMSETRKKKNLNTSKPHDMAERVVEGLALYVQSVEVHFESDCLRGSLMFSGLSVESRSPSFMPEKDLHMTRVHDKNIHQILFFKQVCWNLLKIEASTIKPSDSVSNLVESRKPQGKLHRKSALNSPFRLITDKGRCNIAIKKNDLNCALISGRIQIFLEEILWVANLLQVRSAIDFYKHIKDLASASSVELQVQHESGRSTLSNPTILPPASNPKIPIMEAFRRYDIPRSSHHLYITKVDLHLVDDSSEEALPKNWHIADGAIQATIHKLRVDFYPSHSVFDQAKMFSERDWVAYATPNACTDLVQKQLEHYLNDLRANGKIFDDKNLRERFERTWPQLCSQNVVVCIDDIIVQCVSERSTTKNSMRHMFSKNTVLARQYFQNSRQRHAAEPLPLIRLFSFLHMEIASYYFPGSSEFPLPPDSSHLVLAPFEFLVDFRSIRWIVYVLQNIINAFEEPVGTETENGRTVCQMPIRQPDLRVEFIEPKIVLMTPTLTDDERLPQRFIVNLSSFCISNFVLPFDDVTSGMPAVLDELGRQCASYVKSTLKDLLPFHFTTKLEKKIDKFVGVCNSISSFCFCRPLDDIRLFLSIPSLTFLSDFGPNTYETPITSDISVLAGILPQCPLSFLLLRPCGDIRVILDHFQFVRLIQLHSALTELIDQIDMDQKFFSDLNVDSDADLDSGMTNNIPLAIFCLFEKVRVQLLLPCGPIPSPYDLRIPSHITSGNISTTPPFVTESRNSAIPSVESSGSIPINNDELGGPLLGKGKTPTSSPPPRPPPPTANYASPIRQQPNIVATVAVSASGQFPSSSASASKIIDPTNDGRMGGVTPRSASFVSSVGEWVAGEVEPSVHYGPSANATATALSAMSLTTSTSDSFEISVASLGYNSLTTSGAAAALIAPDIDGISLVTTTTTAAGIEYDVGCGPDDDLDGAIDPLTIVDDAVDAAEEAECAERRERWSRRRAEALSRRCNVLDAQLSDVHVLVAIGANTVVVGCRADRGKAENGSADVVTVYGTASGIDVGEQLKVACGELLTNANTNVEDSCDKERRMDDLAGVVSPKIDFEVHVPEQYILHSNDTADDGGATAAKAASIKINADGGGQRICLTDDVVAQLAPFIENADEEPPANPPVMELNLTNFCVEIRNPKKHNTLRIRVGDLTVKDGESDGQK